MSIESNFEGMDVDNLLNNYWGNFSQSTKPKEEVSVKKDGDLKENGLLQIALLYDEIQSEEDEMDDVGFQEQIALLYDDIPMYDVLTGDGVHVGSVIDQSDYQKCGEALVLEDEYSCSDGCVAESVGVLNGKEESEVEEGETLASMALRQFKLDDESCETYAALLDEKRDSVKQSRSFSLSETLEGMNSSDAADLGPQGWDLSKNVDIRELVFATKNAYGVKSEYLSSNPSQCEKKERLASLVVQATVDSILPDLVQLQDSGEPQEPMLLEEVEGSFNEVSLQRIPMYDVLTEAEIGDGVHVGSVGQSDFQKHGEPVLPFILEDEYSCSDDSVAESVDVLNGKEESEVEEGEILASLPLCQFKLDDESCETHAALLDEKCGSVKQSRSSSSSETLEGTNSSDAADLEPQGWDLSKNIDIRELVFATRNAYGVKSEYLSSSPSQCEKKERLASLVVQTTVDSILPDLVQLQDSGEPQEPMLLEEAEGSFNEVSLQRISAQRTFPPSCGWQSLVEIMGGCEQSVHDFIENMLGYESSIEENKGKKVAVLKNKDIEDRNSSRGKFRGNRGQGVRRSDNELVRKGFDGELRRKYEHESSVKRSRQNSMVRQNHNSPFFSKRLDRRDKHSRQEFGAKHFNIENDRRMKREFPVCEKRHVNQLHLEKHVALKPSMRSAWRQGRDTFTSQDKTSKYNPTSCHNESEDYFPAQGEVSDSPSVKRIHISNDDHSSTTCASNSRDDDIKISVARNEVRKTLRVFHTLCRILLRDDEGMSKGLSGMRQILLTSATILIENNRWLNSDQQIMGSVPGVEIGDEFRHRVELAIIGLHQSYENEINYTVSDGKKLATSIVASGSYDEFLDSSDILVYSGQGRNSECGTKVTARPKLVGGDLALRNSKYERTPVRVIHGFREASSLDSKLNITTLVYDGLYLVEDYWKGKGTHGNIVFMFKLRRIQGQPELAIKQVKRLRKVSIRDGVCVPDISRGTEMIPIAAVNTIDNEAPRSFEYITRMNYPQCYKPSYPHGCQCSDGCSSSMKCSCAMKNAGQIPFNYNGAIVESRPLVYECGPHCRCPPSCYNKVSQHGIKFPLEVFKTKSKGWGVRSLSSIPSGSFVCEYTGELLNEKEAREITGDDNEYLFNIGCSSKNDNLWEGLSELIPSELRSSTSCRAVEDSGLSIDSSKYGNIARFINHSCSPNLYMQSVLYDHHNERMPHMMLFAAENIPPLQELVFNYNMGLDQDFHCDGNAMKFKCCCGSSECSGAVY